MSKVFDYSPELFEAYEKCKDAIPSILVKNPQTVDELAEILFGPDYVPEKAIPPIVQALNDLYDGIESLGVILPNNGIYGWRPLYGYSVLNKNDKTYQKEVQKRLLEGLP